MTKELSNEKIIQTIIAKLMEQNAKYEAEIAKLDIQVHDLNEEMAKLEAKLNCDLPEYDPKISIVDRLRQLGQWTVDGTKSSPIYNRTADYIEKLEATLREIATITTDPEFGTPTIETAIKIANTALKEKKDD